MRYDITFRVKVEGIDQYVPICSCDANIRGTEFLTRI